MSTSIIITISLLLLLAYVFDITASKTKIPSVILLLVLGFAVKIITENLNIAVPDLNPILPILGTIGLILIVLEGSLELEINKSKLPLIFKSSLVALLPLLFISFGIAYYLNYFEDLPLKLALANAIPLGIISSAIAIPSARNLLKNEKEFITYESSLSDIFGVIFFNFITLNDNIGSKTFGRFAIELIIMLVISFVATLLLAGFLNKIKHHIKFVPMIILVLLIYSISKVFHLPALIFILIFGLFIGNIDELRHYKFIQKFHPINFTKNVHKFREITTELAFLIRALFFILFGFLIDIADVLNSETILFALYITLGIFISRFIVLKIFRIQTNPLVFLAPRGLITILLFLSIPISQKIIQIDKSLITQVIILSALIMMIGLMRFKKPEVENVNKNSQDESIIE
ncbi:MAG: cation:proton antiporter [Chitinophagaceae bacterium]|nr:cation:proton antiporter [Chitinophagaceae bacterium]